MSKLSFEQSFKVIGNTIVCEKDSVLLFSYITTSGSFFYPNSDETSVIIKKKKIDESLPFNDYLNAILEAYKDFISEDKQKEMCR